MPPIAPASTRFVPAGTESVLPSKTISGMHHLVAVAERTAPTRDVLLEQRAEMANQPLDRLGRARGERAEGVRPDVVVELVELVDVGDRAAAGLEPLEQLDPDRQAVAARGAEAARLAREEALEIERALERAIVLAEHDERA